LGGRAAKALCAAAPAPLPLQPLQLVL